MWTLGSHFYISSQYSAGLSLRPSRGIVSAYLKLKKQEVLYENHVRRNQVIQS